MESAASPNGQNGSSRPNWVPILGNWDIGESTQTFLGEGQEAFAHGQSFPMGLAASSAVL